MKRFLVFILFIFLLCGCGNNKYSDMVSKLDNKINKADSYYVLGTMEIINNEDTYTYDVSVSYKRDNYYRVSLVNTLNNHEQVILRNDDGVYVVTPSLNKSFKFQSDWPYNNSQVYLLDSIVSDLKNDKNMSSKKIDKGYVFSALVNYPNNKSLYKQNVYVDNKGNIVKVEVVDKDNKVQIVMKYDKIKFNKEFDNNYFELSNLINNSSEEETKSSKTATIDDVIYPMYLPNNTTLANKEVVNTKNGQRLILTFDGDNPFVLVEETASYNSGGMIIPVNGDLEFLTDVIGVVNDNSITWESNGIEYYLVSDVMETSELIDIARSISVLPVSK